MNKGLIIFLFCIILAIVGAILLSNWIADVNSRSNIEKQQAIQGAVSNVTEAINDVNQTMSSQDRQDLIDAMNKLLEAQANLVNVTAPEPEHHHGGGGHSGGGGY